MKKKKFNANDIIIVGLTKSVNFINLIWAVIKIIMGVFTPNYFLVASALFTLEIIATRSVCLKGLKSNDRDLDRKYMGIASLLLVLAGLLYMFYSMRLLFKSTSVLIEFGLFPSIILCVVSLLMLVVAIRGIKKVQKNNRYYHILKHIGFISACIDIMIAQMILLSYLKFDLPTKYNVYLSLLIGLLAIVFGVYNFFRSRYDRKKKKRVINIVANKGLKITLGNETEEWIAFNENLSKGKIKGRFFGEKFNRIRAEFYNVSVKEYKSQNEEFFNFLNHMDKYDIVTLWFGNKIESRINYKAILDCLRERGYYGKVILNTIDEYHGDIYSSVNIDI